MLAAWVSGPGFGFWQPGLGLGFWFWLGAGLGSAPDWVRCRIGFGAEFGLPAWTCSRVGFWLKRWD